MAAQLLPPKEGRLRRIAFAQLALPGRVARIRSRQSSQAIQGRATSSSRLARALPLWLAETFYFSPSYYAPRRGNRALADARRGREPAIWTFGAEWSLENLRQLVESTEGGLDYIVSGRAARHRDGDYEVRAARVGGEVVSRAQDPSPARWTPATADAALARLHAEVRAFMEWSPSSAALAYAIPAQPRAWLDTLGGVARAFSSSG